MHYPQKDLLDFELGAFGDKLKKGFKGATKVLGKVTDATITKPSAFIGGKIGGKKGREIGQKLGGFTSTVTKIGVGAGAAGALAPVLTSPAALTAVGGGMLAKKMAGRKGGQKIKAGLKALSRKPKGKGKRPKAHARKVHSRKPSCKGDNSLAAKVATVLVAKLGGPINEANRALKLADLQRTATYEHKALMSNADFRKKVLAGINAMAANGHVDCQRTIRVLVNR